MSRILFNGSADFDGGVSTADQFFGTVNVSNSFNNNIVYLIDITVTTSVFGVTLQTNLDPDGETLSEWVDYTPSDIRIYDTAGSALLTQTNAGIDSSETRTGIISSTGVYIIKVPNPFPARYRLRFQITGTTVGTLNHIVVSP